MEDWETARFAATLVRIEYQEDQTIAIRFATGASIAGTAPNYNLAVVRLRNSVLFHLK